QIANLCDFTFGLLRRCINVQAQSFGGALKSVAVHPKQALCVRVAKGNDLPVADIEAKCIEVAVPEPPFSFVKHIQRFGLIRFHAGDHLVEHGPSLLGRGMVLLRKRGGRERDRCGRYHAHHKPAYHPSSPWLFWAATISQNYWRTAVGPSRSPKRHECCWRR